MSAKRLTIPKRTTKTQARVRGDDGSKRDLMAPQRAIVVDYPAFLHFVHPGAIAVEEGSML